MPEDRFIPSPGLAAGRAFIAAGLSTTSGIAALWTSLEVQITGSGLAFGLEASAGAIAEISGLAAFGIIGGTLALAAAPVLLTLGGIALFSSNEETLHDVAEGVGVVTEFSSPSTLALTAVTAFTSPFYSTPWRGYQDPMAGQDLTGTLIDFATGLAGGGPGAFFAATGFASQAPDAFTKFQNLQNYLSQQSQSVSNQNQIGSPTPMPSPTQRPGTPSLSPTTSVGSPYFLSPGMGDLDDFSYQSGVDSQTGDVSSSGAFGGGSLTYSLSQGPSGSTDSANAPGSSDVDTSVNGGATDCTTTDCNSDCQHDCQTDCEHDCQSDCQCQCQCDCQTDCDDC